MLFTVLILPRINITIMWVSDDLEMHENKEIHYFLPLPLILKNLCPINLKKLTSSVYCIHYTTCRKSYSTLKMLGMIILLYYIFIESMTLISNCLMFTWKILKHREITTY